MSYRLRSSWLAFVALLVLVPIGACNCNNSSSSTAKEDTNQAKKSSAVTPDKQGKAEADTGSKKEQAADQKAPPTDIYPGMNFGMLSAKARTKFVKIAKAEVCPCKDSTQSLHECLQDEKTACDLAKQVAGLMAMGIQQGYNETDILDKVTEFTDAAKKHYDFQLAGVPHKGPKDAPVQIVEFADFQCPHCKAASPVMEKMVEKYGNKVVYYFKQFPLQSHPAGSLAAHAALAAHEQGKFWQMAKLLFANQRTLNPDEIKTFARRIGMNVSKFEKDMKSQKVDSTVRRDRQEGDEAGINGTPTVYINGRRYLGPVEAEPLSQAIDAALQSAQKGGAQK